MSSVSEIHEYIQKVLERGDHGPNRVMLCDAKTLNHHHAEGIGAYSSNHYLGPTWIWRFLYTAKSLKPHFEKLKEVHSVIPEDHKVTVHNYTGNVTFQCYQATPSSLDELIAVMAKAKQEKLKVRAVGALHSWSWVIPYNFCNYLSRPICETDGYLIQTTKLTGTARTITSTLRDPSAAAGYYDVLCGTPMKEVARELEKEGRALINMGGCSGLSQPNYLSFVIRWICVDFSFFFFSSAHGRHHLHGRTWQRNQSPPSCWDDSRRDPR